jgi:hypothetical protein
MGPAGGPTATVGVVRAACRKSERDRTEQREMEREVVRMVEPPGTAPFRRRSNWATSASWATAGRNIAGLYSLVATSEARGKAGAAFVRPSARSFSPTRSA